MNYVQILSLSAFLFASTTTVAAECIVKDSDIATQYQGGCVNGLAEGKGRASGRDMYSGEFKEGLKHGYGVYEWSDGVRYEGEYVDDKKNGFGKMIIPRSVFSESKSSGKGEWAGDKYIQMGLYSKGNHVFRCKNKSDCEKQSRLEVERKAEEEKHRITRTCNKYHAGYLGNIDFKTQEREWYGSREANHYGNFIVISSGNGMVTIKGVIGPNWRGGGNYPHPDEYLSLSCARLDEIER